MNSKRQILMTFILSKKDDEMLAFIMWQLTFT